MNDLYSGKIFYKNETAQKLRKILEAPDLEQAMSFIEASIQNQTPYQGLNILVIQLQSSKLNHSTIAKNFKAKIIYEKIGEQVFPWNEDFNWEDEQQLVPIAYQLNQIAARSARDDNEITYEFIPNLRKHYHDYTKLLRKKFPRYEQTPYIKEFFQRSKWGKEIQHELWGYPLYTIHPLKHGLESMLQIILPPYNQKLFVLHLFFSGKHNNWHKIKRQMTQIIPELFYLQSYLYKAMDIEIFRESKNKQVANALQNMLNLLFNAIKARDHETGQHQARIQFKGSIFLKTLLRYNFANVKVSEREKDIIHLLGPGQISDLFRLHDIGKIGIPDRILQKQDSLNDTEYALMKQHVTIGVDIILEALRFISDPSDEITLLYQTLVDIIWSHHERYDGKGYPLGLQGSEISLLGRIMTLIDAQDAMRHQRVYKQEISYESVVQTITEEKNKHFDPDLVQYYLKYLKYRFERIDLRYND